MELVPVLALRELRPAKSCAVSYGATVLAVNLFCSRNPDAANWYYFLKAICC